MFFFGMIFIVSTTLVFLFKHEVDEASVNNEEEFTVKETYHQMWKMVWLVPIKKLAIILLTVKVFRIDEVYF